MDDSTRGKNGEDISDSVSAISQPLEEEARLSFYGAAQRESPRNTVNIREWNATFRPVLDASATSLNTPGRYPSTDIMPTEVSLQNNTLFSEWGDITPKREDLAGFYWLHKHPTSLRDFWLLYNTAYLKFLYDKVVSDLERVNAQSARAAPVLPTTVR